MPTTESILRDSAIKDYDSFISFADNYSQIINNFNIKLHISHLAIKVTPGVFDKVCSQMWNRNISYTRDYRLYNSVDIEYNNINFKLYIKNE